MRLPAAQVQNFGRQLRSLSTDLRHSRNRARTRGVKESLSMWRIVRGESDCRIFTMRQSRNRRGSIMALPMRSEGTSARLSTNREVNFCAKHVLKHVTTLRIYVIQRWEDRGGWEDEKEKKTRGEQNCRWREREGEGQREGGRGRGEGGGERKGGMLKVKDRRKKVLNEKKKRGR